MRPILALVASAEVRLGLAAAELAPDLEEISKVLDGTPLAELTLGAEVYARMEADGVSPITRDRVGYYAMFYWARGKERADKIAAAMWTPDREISEDDVPGEARRR